MIQFNLLPDVKLQYIRAQRSRRLVIGIAVLVTAASVLFLVLLLSVDGLQKKHLSDLNRDIISETAALQHKSKINTILTVQNQLQSLTALHADKPAADRLFNYLNELTPATVNITNLNIGFTQDTLSISGTADAFSSVTQYVDTLKLTTYTTNQSATAKPAFSNVVLSSFSVNSNNNNASQAADYSISLSYDKNIFDITKDVTLAVPTVTTRAQLQSPSDLFTADGSGGKQ